MFQKKYFAAGAVVVAALCVGLTTPRCTWSQSPQTRQQESLDRGFVAFFDTDSSAVVSWRLLATESMESKFFLFRAVDDREPELVEGHDPLGPTWFRDSNWNTTDAVTYSLRASADATAPPLASTQLSRANQSIGYMAIPLKPPEGYHANDTSVGDLDGDGLYEWVVHMVGQGRDNSQGGFTTEPILHAYKLDGTLLWDIHLGKNIREGAHYTAFLVYDLDGDGRAEVVCKTADGTRDGKGNVLGDAKADHRTQEGRRAGTILAGPEFLTVFDGPTGAALASRDYIPARGNVRAWGDDYGNRSERYLAGIAYLDGERPSIVMCRGYYTRSVLAAWDYRDGNLQSRWVFDSDDGTPGNEAYRGQGNHSLSVADIDQDGKDEIVYGACAIDDDGRGLYSTGFGHGDALHVTDIDPVRPGLEAWSIHENEKGDAAHPGVTLFSAKDGAVIFRDAIGRDVGRGMAADIDPRHPGVEVWGGLRNAFSSSGKNIGAAPRSTNFGIWWDGDLLRELLNGVDIAKWDYREARGTLVLGA